MTIAAREATLDVHPGPILLIYAGNGRGGEDLNPAYYTAAGEPKSLWRVAGSDHTGGLETAPRASERRVVGFFGRALLGTPDRRSTIR